MTAKQTSLYWREWSAARAALIGHGYAPAEADQERHNLHIQALGKDRSSKALSNRDFDQILATFRAVSRPYDLDAQMRGIEGRRRRRIWAIRHAGLPDSYLAKISHDLTGSRYWEFLPDDKLELVWMTAKSRSRRRANATRTRSQTTPAG